MDRGLGKTKKVLLQKCHSFQTNQEFFHAYFETSSKPDGRTFKKRYHKQTTMQPSSKNAGTIDT